MYKKKEIKMIKKMKMMLKIQQKTKQTYHKQILQQWNWDTALHDARAFSFALKTNIKEMGTTCAAIGSLVFL